MYVYLSIYIDICVCVHMDSLLFTKQHEGHDTSAGTPRLLRFLVSSRGELL